MVETSFGLSPAPRGDLLITPSATSGDAKEDENYKDEHWAKGELFLERCQ